MRVYAGTNNTIVLAQDDGTERREIPSTSFQIEAIGDNIGLYNQVTKQFDVKVQHFSNILNEEGNPEVTLLNTFTRLSNLINISTSNSGDSGATEITVTTDESNQLNQTQLLNELIDTNKKILFFIKAIAE